MQQLLTVRICVNASGSFKSVAVRRLTNALHSRSHFHPYRKKPLWISLSIKILEMDSCYPTEEPEKLWINRVGIQTVRYGKVVIEEGEIWRKRKKGRGDECGFRLPELIKGSIYQKGNSEGKGLKLKSCQVWNITSQVLQISTAGRQWEHEQEVDTEISLSTPQFRGNPVCPTSNFNGSPLTSQSQPRCCSSNGQTAISNSNTHNNRGGAMVKVLCHKSECRWFDPSCCHWKFSLT